MDPVFRVDDRHGPERITAGTRIQGIAVTVHSYRIGSTLIDAGPPNRVGALVDHLGPGAIEEVLLTHHHPDHIGAAARLHGDGATVRAHEDALHPLWNLPAVGQETRQVWGAPDRVDAECLEPTMAFDHVHVDVVPTPGHSDDHVAFHLPEEGWVFTGDAYIGPRVALGPEEDLDAMLASYQRIRDLSPERMFPGHGAVVNDPEATLTKTVEHFEGLRERAWALHDDGWVLEAIVDELFEARTGRYTSGRFTHENLARALLDRRPA